MSAILVNNLGISYVVIYLPSDSVIPVLGINPKTKENVFLQILFYTWMFVLVSFSHQTPKQPKCLSAS